ncbi:hypothetical protein QA641_11110 [Bradyrhizobium sp. CB1650]|uniref:hypothetical protein n=1 Tax=Bradyrhizobium sp. CB1650 TaxID=3039153 RepID=UPI00243583A1|nr:hypothetical protein [Bradyrhizobium sp. CB1650]WGD54400.1 hypothetical protein QA641_11110 [Bradyrhizobium sp. CB1650]
MGSAMMNTLIVAGIICAIGYGWITYIQNRGRPQSRAGAGADSGGDGYAGTSDGFSLGSWFSGSSGDSGSCSSGDSGGGGDCGGDSGGGGGGD